MLLCWEPQLRHCSLAGMLHLTTVPLRMSKRLATWRVLICALMLFTLRLPFSANHIIVCSLNWKIFPFIREEEAVWHYYPEKYLDPCCSMAEEAVSVILMPCYDVCLENIYLVIQRHKTLTVIRILLAVYPEDVLSSRKWGFCPFCLTCFLWADGNYSLLIISPCIMKI